MHHVRTRRYGGRLVALVASGSLVLGFVSAARADTVYDTVNGGSVDSVIETMTLPVTTTGLTTLKMDAPKRNEMDEADTDHPGCNIPGNHSLAMTAFGFNPETVSVSFVNDPSDVGDLEPNHVFNSCSEVLTVRVTALAVGFTTVSFSGEPSDPNDPHLGYSYDEAAFNVNVTAGEIPPPPVVCDADPAAPAWANAILKAYGIKNKATIKNTISSVAYHMTQGAKFGDNEKNTHPDYEQAVYDYLNDDLALDLPTVANWTLITRPGWECSEVPQS